MAQVRRRADPHAIRGGWHYGIDQWAKGEFAVWGGGQRGDTEVVSGHRLRVRLFRLAAACAAPALYGLWFRPRVLIWGATADQMAGAYPGDELVADPNGGRRWP